MEFHNMVGNFEYSDIELLEAWKEQKLKAMKQLMYRTALDSLVNDTAEMNDVTRAFFDKFLNKKVQAKSTHVLITVNPKDDDLPLLIKCVEKFLKHKWIKNYMYAFEQRGVKDIKGFHVHILIDRVDIEPARLIKETRSSFSKIPMNKESINFRWANEKGYKNFIHYILKDDIKDPEQVKKSEVDKIFRNKNNLLPVYVQGSFESPHTCRDSEEC